MRSKSAVWSGWNGLHRKCHKKFVMFGSNHKEKRAGRQEQYGVEERYIDFMREWGQKRGSAEFACGIADCRCGEDMRDVYWIYCSFAYYSESIPHCTSNSRWDKLGVTAEV